MHAALQVRLKIATILVKLLIQQEARIIIHIPAIQRVIKEVKHRVITLRQTMSLIPTAAKQTVQAIKLASMARQNRASIMIPKPDMINLAAHGSMKAQIQIRAAAAKTQNVIIQEMSIRAAVAMFQARAKHTQIAADQAATFHLMSALSSVPIR